MSIRSIAAWACVWLAGGAAATAQPLVGWRGNGAGSFPDAAGPVRWSADSNVAWKTATASWSNSTPTVVGQRLFVCAEKDVLLCLSTADGRVLWQKASSYADVMTEQDKAQAEADRTAAADLRAQQRPLRGEQGKLRSALSKDRDNAELKKKVLDLGKRIAELEARLGPLTRWEQPKTEGNNGYTSQTVASDGKCVWVLFGSGLAACYDLDGNRKWIRMIEKPTNGWGHSASPVLADGGRKLIVHVLTLTALDAATGKTLWQADGPSPHWGTPAVATVGGVELIVTPGGDVVRVRDGAVLARKLANLAYNAPVVAGEVAYFVDGAGATAVKLGPIEGDTLQTKALWKAKAPKDRHYASPLLCGKVLYGLTQKGVLTAIDAEGGQVLYEKDLDLGRGTCYPSLARAGDRVYASIDNGTTVVFKAGREFNEAARNTLEKFRGSPTFVGPRLYIRGYKHVWCIAERNAN